jgi:hypothetical protein
VLTDVVILAGEVNERGQVPGRSYRADTHAFL